MSGLPRVFLGWNSAILPNFAAYLLQEYGPDLGQLQLALPGRRAGRRLLELLLEQAPPSWIPPRTMTIGQLSDELTVWPLPRASDAHRDLAWVAALRACTAAELSPLLPDPPAAAHVAAWLPLAALLRNLHSQLAAEGWTFSQAASQAEAPEQDRWHLLARLQQDYIAHLARVGLGDPHLMRLEALAAGSFCAPQGEVLLLGVVEANRLQREVLAKAPLQGKILIGAPESLADGFDQLGMPLPAFWQQQELALSSKRLHLCEDPAQQAEKLLQTLASHRGSLAAEELTLGLLHPDSLPRLERQLSAQGASLHAAGGKSLHQAGPLRLLQAVATWVASPSADSLAALLRHPDAEAALAHAMDHAPSPAALDLYLQEHVVARAAPPWLDSKAAPVSAATANLKTQSALLWRWTEELRSGTRPPQAWVPALHAFLHQVFAELALDRSKEGDRQTAVALDACAKALTAWRQLPATGPLAPPLDGPAAIGLFLQQVGAGEIPPAQRRGTVVDAVGWLELALDDAPALLVTDLQEGLVPSAPAFSPWLEAPLRARLGLDDDARRLARDHYLLQCLQATRSGSADGLWPQFFLCRHDQDGTPRQPSRLLFRGPQEQRLERAALCFGKATKNSQPAASMLPQPVPWPGIGIEVDYEKEIFSCSRLNSYLHSPYAFFLRQALRLEEIEEAPRELDALQFGNLLHAVLETYGRAPELRELQDEEQIHTALLEILAEESAQRYGSPPRPTVALQLRQVDYRLQLFARTQATIRADGWRIHAVEWEPQAESVAITMDGESFRLRGRIDRIDLREEGGRQEWRIIDYKSGDKPFDRKHCVSKGSSQEVPRWKDVQLALYPYLAAEMVGPARAGVARQDVEACYWNLSAEETDHGLLPVSSTFIEEQLAELPLQVAAAVRGIRAGHFFDPQQRPPSYDAFTLRCMGQGLLVGGEDEEEEDEEGKA